MVALKPHALRLLELIKRHPGLIAVFGFVSGLASFLLVDRRESLAQIIALLMLVSWAWLLAENWLRAGILQRFGFEMPPAVMRFGTQLVHQESLFFTLPFFLAATTWDHGQAVFTGLLLLCALISLIDPLYYNQLAPRRSLYVAFHSLTLFAVLLAVNPLLLNLTTGQSLLLALALSLLLSLPSLGDLLPTGRRWRLPLLIFMLVVMAIGTWEIRTWIPPAGLRLTDVRISQELNRDLREPGESLNQISTDTLRREGLYAWTAVRAPRGLREKVYHVWLHNGVEVDRIPQDIRGGREEGYRAWSHKRNFPLRPEGRWQVRVMTGSGQLIGLARFRVVAAAVDPADTLPIDPSPIPTLPEPETLSLPESPDISDELSEPQMIEEASSKEIHNNAEPTDLDTSVIIETPNSTEQLERLELEFLEVPDQKQ